MSDKKIKLIALSVSMVLSTHMVLAEDLITDFGGLKDALKNATGSSVTVKLGSDISATARITIGTNTPTSVTILGESKKYGSTTLAFDVKYNTTLTLNNITLDSIQHGSSWGGAMYNEGTLILDNVIFNNNIAKTPKAVGGGAMALVATRKNPVSTTIKNSTFTNNSTVSSPSYENNGGAIYVYGTYGLVGNNTLNISDSHFESNNTNKTGGAIGVNNLGPSKFEIEIKDTTFTKNNSTGYGGAIDVTTGDTGKVTLNLYNATFNANKSGSDGGAIAYEKGNITSNIINSKFTNNTASTVNGSSAHGGAIYTRQDLVINANNNGLSEFTGNYVTTDGGATRNYEAINVGASGKTLTLNATTNGTILLNDYINGVNGYNVLLTGDSTGTIKLFDKADIKGGANVTVGGNVVIDTADGIIQNFSEFNSLNSSTSAKYNIDIDLSKANGDQLDYTIGDKIADGFTTQASSNGSIITLDSLNFLGNSFDDFLDKNLKIQIIQNNENTDDLQLALSDKLTPLTSTAGRIKHIVTTKTNSITPTANYKDVFGSITTTKDVYGILGLNKTNTTNDSLNLKVTKIDTDIDDKTSDALVALTNTELKDNDGNILDKTFNLFDEDSLGNKTPANYKLSDNLGSIYKNLNIVGATKTDTLGEITLSELDLNGKSSFVVNSGSTLNISDIKLKGNETVIKNNGGSLNFANNNIIDGKITGTTATNTGVLGINANNLDVALINNGTLNLGVGNIEKEITGSGLTNILDVVTNNAFISQNVNVDSSGILTVNANIGNLINRGEVTSNTNNLTGSITNSGILILSGTLDKTILGNGTTKVNGLLNLAPSAIIDGVLDLNNGTISTSDLNYSKYDIKTLDGVGNATIDVDWANSKADSFNTTSGSGVLNLTLNQTGTENIWDTKTIKITNGGVGIFFDTITGVKEKEILGSDDLQANVDWADKFGAWKRTDTYSETTSAIKSIGSLVNDSIQYEVIKTNEGIKTYTTDCDTLALLIQNSIAGSKDKTFTTTNANNVYSVKENLGILVDNLTISGTSDGTNTSTIILGDKQGISISDANSLTVKDVKISSDGLIINATSNNAKISLDNATLQGDVLNQGDLSVKNSTLVSKITGTGKTDIDTTGKVIVSELIQNELTNNGFLNVNNLKISTNANNSGSITNNGLSSEIKNLYSINGWHWK